MEGKPVENAGPTLAAIFAEVRVLSSKFETHEREEATARVQRQADRTEIITRLSALEASENQRKGRDGVLAAILRSPAVAWLTGIGAAIGAYFAGSGHAAGQ